MGVSIKVSGAYVPHQFSLKQGGVYVAGSAAFKAAGFYVGVGAGGAPVDPALSSPSVTVLNETSASASVSFNQNNGIVYWIASTSATQPTTTQIKAGQTHAGVAATASGSQAVDSSGVQSVFGNVNGLTQGVTYFMHFYAETDALAGTAIVSTSGFVPADVTGPVLSSAEGTQTGATTANLTVNTDTGAGTLYWVATTSATAPSAAQIIAGQNHLGAAAINGSRAVSATGPQAFGITGLSGNTEYWPHFLQRDVAMNNSNVATAPASFTTTSITYYFEQAHNGNISSPQLTNSLLDVNYSDSIGGSNAVLWSGDGLGTAVAETISLATANTFLNGVTRVRAKFKTLNSAAAKMWIEARTVNVTAARVATIDVTNDATPDGSRLNAGATFTNTSIVSIGSGWLQFQADVDMTGSADLVGNVVFAMAANPTTKQVNNVVGQNQIAVHEITLQLL